MEEKEESPAAACTAATTDTADAPVAIDAAENVNQGGAVQYPMIPIAEMGAAGVGAGAGAGAGVDMASEGKGEDVATPVQPQTPQAVGGTQQEQNLTDLFRRITNLSPAHTALLREMYTDAAPMEIILPDDADGKYKDWSVLVIYDAWFGSVKAAAAHGKAKIHFVGGVKTCHAGFPKAAVLAALADKPAGCRVVAETKVEGVDLVVIGFKYNRKKVLFFIATKGSGSTFDGAPYIAKFPDQVSAEGGGWRWWCC